uniref:hypothetical protein n=1 Tax=Treponema sp. TaxID=166 RepID=UPI00388EBC4A
MYIGLLKKTLVFLLFILCCRVFASGGALAESSSPLHVIRTQYFDIIFPEECCQTAHKIEDVCDDYYLEITSLLETEPYQRFPVTITRSVEVLNAYYAAIPYNRIVLYDTLPETSLDMYEDTIQSVFYHELTHAVTYNIKSKWSKRLSFISDALNPAWFTVTTFWAEGATVSFESKKQGGRLNDPFSTQIVNQSVIEDKFPNWRDVTGARDTYPGGTDAYMFGSMFASYLQDTYGMSKYAEFWKNAGSRLSFSFIAGVFEKTYGMSVGDAWDDFEKTLQIEHSTKTANLFSNKNSRISSFDVFFDDTETKIAYFDSASSSLRLVILDSDGKIKKNKKLLAVTGINRVVFSSDGTKLALSRYIDKKNYKCVAAEYDLKKKKYNEQKITNRRDAFFIQTDNKNELSFVEMSQYRDGEIVFSPVEIEKNLYASIVKDSLKWKIRLSDSEKTLIDYDFSEISGGDIARNLILHELHSIKSDSDSIWLSFTWAELGKGGKMLSRIGFLKVDRSSMNVTAFLQKENSFAGFTDAVPSKNVLKNIENSDEFGSVFDVYAVASEYEKSPLYKVEMKTGDFEKIF